MGTLSQLPTTYSVWSKILIYRVLHLGLVKMQWKFHVWRASYWHLGPDEINDWPDVSCFHSRYLAGNREYLNFLACEGHLANKAHFFIGVFGRSTDPLMWNSRKLHNELLLTQCHIYYEVGSIWIWIPYLLWSRPHLNLNSIKKGLVTEFF